MEVKAGSITQVRPFGPRILVRRYQYPKRMGSIFLPLDTDESGTLWDLVEASEEAEAYLGMELSDKVIIETPSDVAVELGVDDLWIIYATNVISLIPWEDDDGDGSGGGEAGCGQETENVGGELGRHST